MGDEDILDKLKLLRSQKEVLRASVMRAVDNMMATRIATLKSEGVDVDDPRIKPAIDKMLQEFRTNIMKKLLDEETREIDEKIKAYSNLL